MGAHLVSLHSLSSCSCYTLSLFHSTSGMSQCHSIMGSRFHVTLTGAQFNTRLVDLFHVIISGFKFHVGVLAVFHVSSREVRFPYSWGPDEGEGRGEGVRGEEVWRILST